MADNGGGQDILAEVAKQRAEEASNDASDFLQKIAAEIKAKKRAASQQQAPLQNNNIVGQQAGREPQNLTSRQLAVSLNTQEKPLVLKAEAKPSVENLTRFFNVLFPTLMGDSKNANVKKYMFTLKEGFNAVSLNDLQRDVDKYIGRFNQQQKEQQQKQQQGQKQQQQQKVLGDGGEKKTDLQSEDDQSITVKFVKVFSIIAQGNDEKTITVDWKDGKLIVENSDLQGGWFVQQNLENAYAGPTGRQLG